MKGRKLLIGCLTMLLLTFAAACALAEVKIDDTHFPDPVFRLFVSELIDEDGNGVLNDEEISKVEGIDCSELGIGNLTGIEYFQDLMSLYCDSNRLSSLDVSRNEKLMILSCTHNYLKGLDVSRNQALMLLSCDYNTLNELNVRQNPYLVYLSCERTGLSSLDVTQNEYLMGLVCNGNPLNTLDVSHNPYLESLTCMTCQLAYLDVSQNPNLVELNCYGNHMACIDLQWNTALETCDVSGNSRTIEALGGVFDLSTLPGFDVTKASNWIGCTVEGTILRKQSSGSVNYTYDCGNGISAPFGLTVYIRDVTPGDVNGDGTVDGRDALRLLKYLAGQDVTIVDAAADMNGDGAVDGRDALRLMKQLAGQ